MTPDQAKEHLLEVADSGVVTRSRKYVEIQLDVGTWDALQDWKRQGAVLSEPAPAVDRNAVLALLRHELQLDENGDSNCGVQPLPGWETGYCAGLRTAYRALKGHAK